MIALSVISRDTTLRSALSRTSVSGVTWPDTTASPSPQDALMTT